MDGVMDGWMDGWMDGSIDRSIDRPPPIVSVGDAMRAAFLYVP